MSCPVTPVSRRIDPATRRAGPKPDATDSRKRCSYGDCYAILEGRGRSQYCHPDHAELARYRRAVDADANKAAEDVYERAIEQMVAGRYFRIFDLESVGWFGTTSGLVMHGSTVQQIRTLVDAARADEAAFRHSLFERKPIDRELITAYDASQHSFDLPAKALVLVLARSVPHP